MSKARLNLTEICQKCGVTYSIIQNIHPSGKSTYQAQFHCKDVVEQKRLKAALALSLEEKECYNKTEFDMKWRELSLTPDDYVFTLTSNETYTLLGYSNSQNFLGEYLKAPPKRGGAGDTTEYKFEKDMNDATLKQNYLLDTFSNTGVRQKPIVDDIQALALLQKAAQVVNAKTFMVDVNTGIIFDCNSEADVYRLESLLLNQITNNGFSGFRKDVKIESTKTGYRLTFPPANIPRLLGFNDSTFNYQLKSDLDTCKAIISNIKGTHILPLSQNAQKEIELRKLVKEVGATSYSIVSYRKGPGVYTYSVKFIFDELKNIQKLKKKAVLKLENQDGLLNEDGFLKTIPELGGKYSLTLTANQMYHQLGYDAISGGDFEYDRFAQDLDKKLKSGMMKATTTAHKTEDRKIEDRKIIDLFMIVRSEYYRQRHCGHVTNGAGHSEKIYVGQIKAILAAGPRSINRMMAEAETLHLWRTKPDYCTAIYGQYKISKNPEVTGKKPYVRMGFLAEDGEFFSTSKQFDLETRVLFAIMQDVINFIAGNKEITIGDADEEIYNITFDEFQKGLEEVRKLYEKYGIDYRKTLPKN